MKQNINSIAVIGMQWGDEGKGKIIDFLAAHADVIARFNGGNNAGHTIKAGDTKLILHVIPSGVMYQNTVNLIGNGVVIDPKNIIQKEMAELKENNIPVSPKNLIISSNAHVILPGHIERDKKTGSSIGTTARGIGPCYTDKIARSGLRMHEFCTPQIFEARYGTQPFFTEYQAYAKILAPFVKDTVSELHALIAQHKKILYEGAQGTLLDIDHGTYPFVTSSNTIAGGICTGLGVGPKNVGLVLGVIKAYTTRVGMGPFPTELTDALAEQLQVNGNEFGSTTGRKRRVGWFDALAARYAVMLNGADSVAVTKLDVLSGFPKIKLCIAYEHDGNRIEQFTNDAVALEHCKPIYEEFAGWSEDISAITSYEELPANAKKYLQRLEQVVGVPVSMVSVGPARTQSIIRKKELTGFLV